MGDRENCRVFPIPVGWGVVIWIVVSRVGLTAMLVAVLANVEVEVEEVGAELAMPVPVAGGLKAEASDAEHTDQTQDRAGQPEDSKDGSAKAPHVSTPR